MVRRLVLLGCLALCACTPPGDAPSIANARLAAPVPEFGPQVGDLTRQRVKDLIAINHALEIYRSGHDAQYPRSSPAFDSYASLGERWMPQIATRYISPLPHDPAGGSDPAGPQYLYWSDGRDFKLIATDTGDCSPAVETGGVRIDPKRSDAAGCKAYGFWSEGGAGR